MQKALITGATAGIGRATALALAKEGVNLVLCGRRVDRLNSLSAEIEKQFKVKTQVLAFDVSKRSECELAIVKGQGFLGDLDVLINNAGLGKGLEGLDSGQMDHWDAMIDTNVKGLLYMTRLLLPGMLQRKKGHIVNIGSVAGRWVYPKGAVYCATKFAVRALTEGLRLDLLGKPIRVTAIEPGMVETEFSAIRFEDPERARAIYRGMTPLSADDIADSIVWCLRRPAHVNIQELVIYPTEQASVRDVSRQP